MNEFNPIELNANRERQEAEERMAKAAVEQEARDLSAVMASPTGRRLVHRILMASGVFDQAPTGAPTVYEDGRREGRRDIGLGLLRFLNGPCLGSYVLMLKDVETNE